MGEPAGGSAGSGLPDPGTDAGSPPVDPTVYEDELAKALAADEIRPWIAERIIEEDVLRAAATGEEAVRDAVAAAAEERARLRPATERVERLDAALAGYTPQGTWIFVSITLAVAVPTALLYLTHTHPVATVLLAFLTFACVSGLASRFTGVVVPRSGAGYDEYRQAQRMTEANQRAMEMRRLLRRERRAAEAERDAAETVWREALRERGILPRLRLAVNAALDGGDSTTLLVRDRKGLGGAPDPARLIDTTAAPRLRALIEETRGATIAVAGPHGVGKSTLLHAVCAGRYTRPGEPPDLAVPLAAPVRYVPREFVLTLYAAVCRAVLADAGSGPIGPAVPVPAPPRTSVVVRALPWLALAAGAGLLAWPWPRRLATAAGHHLTSLGLTLTVVGVGWAAGRFARRRRATAAPALADLARDHLVRLRFVQSVAYGRTGTAGLPLGIGAQLSRTLTVTTQAPTYPELVDDLRGFLTLLGRHLRDRGRRLIIAVDELDRIGAQAREFLGELKAVFGVPNCFFLVSVADDLATGFTGRHLPAVDPLEGAFDDLVRMNFLTWRESRDLLQRRVIGLSTPFALLCHVLSGGVARELIRTTRRLLWLHDTAGTDRLPPLATLLTGAELAERVEAVRAAAMLVHESAPGATTGTGGTGGTGGPADGPARERLLLDLDRARDALDDVRPDRWRTAHGRLAAALARDGDDGTRTVRESVAVRACFHLTVVELVTAWCEDGFAAERWTADADALAALARACGTEPALARHRLDDLRRRHGLAPAPGHAGDPARPPEAGRGGGATTAR